MGEGQDYAESLLTRDLCLHIGYGRNKACLSVVGK